MAALHRCGTDPERASPKRAGPKEENSRGREVKLLSEGNWRVPKAADVSPEMALPGPPWSYCGKLSLCPGVRGRSG